MRRYLSSTPIKYVSIIALTVAVSACSKGDKRLEPVVSAPVNLPSWDDFAALQLRVADLEREVRRLRQRQPLKSKAMKAPKDSMKETMAEETMPASPPSHEDIIASYLNLMKDKEGAEDVMETPGMPARSQGDLRIEDLEPAAKGIMSEDVAEKTDMAENDAMDGDSMVDDATMVDAAPDEGMAHDMADGEDLTFGAETPTPEIMLKDKPKADGKFAVHLASYQNADMALDGWEDLLNEHGDLLSDKVPMLAELDLGASGRYFRLKAVGFGDSASAMAACDVLAQRQQYCALSDANGKKIAE